MIDKKTAKQIVLDRINANNNQPLGFEWQIIDDATIETQYGWVFFYQTKLCLNKQSSMYSRAGNYPIIVDKDNGELYYLNPNEEPIEVSLKEFEKTKNKIIPDYYDLDFFLQAYMENNNMKYFSDERAAIQYYVAHAKKVEIQKVIAQGQAQISEKMFPVERISSRTNRYFENAEKARKWLAEIIQILESTALV